MKTKTTKIRLKNLLSLMLVVHLAFISFFTSLAQWQATSCPYSGSMNTLAAFGSKVFAGNGGGVYLSSNDGNSWTNLNAGMTTPYVYAFASDGTNLYSGTAGGGVYISTNNGNSWTAVNNGLTDLGVSSLVINGTNVYVGTSGGVYLSNNNGSSWTSVSTGLTNTDISCLLVKGTKIFAGTLGGGVFVSNNNGNSWTAVNSGLTAPQSNIFALASNGTHIFAATFGGVYVSNNEGTGWSAMNAGLGNLNIYSFAINGSNIYAGSGGGVFHSTNNGTNWTAINTGLANLSILCMTVNGTYLFAGTNTAGVWKRSLSEITGIDNITEDNSISIYPNPITSTSVLRINKRYKNIEVSISNILGNELNKQILSENTMTFEKESFAKGIYFVRITADGQQFTKKIIIQ